MRSIVMHRCADSSTFPKVLESILPSVFSTSERQSKFISLGALAEAQHSSGKRVEPITLTEAAGMKLVVDSYLLRKFWERVRTRIPSETA